MGKHLSPDEKKKIDLLADRYFIEGRDYEKDLISFSNHCSVNNAPTTGRLYVSIAREFLSFNDIDLTRKQERNVKKKIPRGGMISEEDELTKESIRKLLNASSLALKTLVLILLTSGMRIGELLDLRIGDIEIVGNGEYGIVSLRGKSISQNSRTKNSYSRTTFINKEAAEVLLQWLEKRSDYIEMMSKKSNGRWTPKDIDDGRIFPFSDANAGQMLRTALKKANLFRVDRDTKRSTIHFHLFRKYFVTQLSSSGIPEKHIDFFVGHLGELDRTYNKQTKEKLLEFYRRGEPYLRVYDESAGEIAKTQEEIKETKDRMRDIQIGNLEMRAKLQDFDKMQARLEEIERRLKNPDPEAKLDFWHWINEHDRQFTKNDIEELEKRGFHFKPVARTNEIRTVKRSELEKAGIRVED
jgi:integrase